MAAVLVPHGALADYVVDAQGREWVRKKEINTGFQALLGEAFGSLFASELDVRAPQSAVQEHRGERAWLSRVIPDATHWNADKIPFIENLENLGRMLALDALLANEDRHRGNILLQSTGVDRDSFEVWSIDLGNALVGFPADFLDIGLEIPDPRNLAPGIPVSAIEEGAIETALRAESIGQPLIAEFCREACELVQEPTVAEYSAVLSRRCQNARQIVQQYLSTITSLP